MKREDVSIGEFAVVEGGPLVYICSTPDEHGMVLVKPGAQIDDSADMTYHHDQLREAEPEDWKEMQ